MKFEEIKSYLLPLREQAEIENAWLSARLETIMPVLMQRAGIDFWLITCREYNEDPVIMTMLPAPAMSARRRTMLAFVLNENNEVERFALDRYGYKGFYEPIWNPEEVPDQYQALKAFIEEINPRKIGLNTSKTFAFGDGLSHTEHENLLQGLGPELSERIVPGEPLAVGWLESRIPAEMKTYADIVSIGHAIIAKAYSREVITPGVTTTDDVVWWMRQTMADFGLRAWFQPSIEIQAANQSFVGVVDQPARTLIQPGDLLHCDMGFVYLRLATDQQQHAYVLREGETAAPAGLMAALQAGNRVQDIHMEEMQRLRTGNDVLAAVRQRAIDEGLVPQIYSHPLGFHGHAAGPTIGLWDMQGGVPGNGDYPIYPNTAYSIELNAKSTVSEWQNQEVRIALEEDAYFDGVSCSWLDGRQTKYHLI